MHILIIMRNRTGSQCSDLGGALSERNEEPNNSGRVDVALPCLSRSLSGPLGHHR